MFYYCLIKNDGANWCGVWSTLIESKLQQAGIESGALLPRQVNLMVFDGGISELV